MQPNRITTVETLLPSACILAIPMLYVRPSSWCFELKVYVHRGRVCHGSVGTRQDLLQGWLLCFGFEFLANVPDLVRRHYIIPSGFMKIKFPSSLSRLIIAALRDNGVPVALSLGVKATFTSAAFVNGYIAIGVGLL